MPITRMFTLVLWSKPARAANTIVHPETLTRCQADEVGEIWVSGQVRGWNRPEEHFALTYYTGERSGDLGFSDGNCSSRVESRI